MAEENKSDLTKKSLTTAKNPLSRLTKINITESISQPKMMVKLGHLLVAGLAILAALQSAREEDWVQRIENKAVTNFYQIRGQKVAPQDIIILAIDEQSISTPQQLYQDDPQNTKYFKPLRSFPYERTAYAQAISKLINAGARVVALDILFETPSIYGQVDDQQFQEVLKKYGDQVTLAALYAENINKSISIKQVIEPLQIFQTGGVSIGTANFPKVDGKVHRLGSTFSKIPSSFAHKNIIQTKLPSFGEAVLEAGNINYTPPQGDRIYFWGNRNTFQTYPFWYVFEPEYWKSNLQQGKIFENKIVLIGATAESLQDLHRVAISQYEKMPGVEIHANAIATLMENKSIATAIKNPLLRGLFVLLLVIGAATISTRKKQGIYRLLISIAIASLWGGISYSSYIYSHLMFPTTVPMMAITLSGLSYLGTEVAKDKINKQKLLLLFQKHKSSSVVQDIISQQEELQDLIQKRDLELNGKILSSRYKIVKVLGAGGFSETYIAEDIQLPEHPQCVVKQLKPATAKPENLALARRLFGAEAKTLEKLGTHQQIPQLLAYFEEDEEFYLVQEYIKGHDLGKELVSGKYISEISVIAILKDILEVLRFVHGNGVIHRDIKPGNIIRRHSDWKLVLIDFGAVKEMNTQVMENLESTAFTIGIGTKGYAPNEQCFGRPRYNSDIYALGMIAIKALTGISPHELKRKDYDSEVEWMENATVSPELSAIINKMVLEDYKKRYNSALEILEEIEKLPLLKEANMMTEKIMVQEDILLFDSDSDTKPWPEEMQ